MERDKNKLKAETLSTLAQEYGVDVRTFKGWLSRAKIKIIRKGPGSRSLPPAKVAEIRAVLDGTNSH